MRALICFVARYWYAVAGGLIVVAISFVAGRPEIGVLFFVALMTALAI